MTTDEKDGKFIESLFEDLWLDYDTQKYLHRKILSYLQLVREGKE